ncbi:Uncharacterised protein [Mycobacteroides abscessus subsp. abscessus]|nr:Uncharacterised protein [Mycobacteroides abscessus subsp. abscessus]
MRDGSFLPMISQPPTLIVKAFQRSIIQFNDSLNASEIPFHMPEVFCAIELPSPPSQFSMSSIF